MKLFQNHISPNTLLLAVARRGFDAVVWCLGQNEKNYGVTETLTSQSFQSSTPLPLRIVYSIVNLIDSQISDFAYLTQKMSLIPITVPIARNR